MSGKHGLIAVVVLFVAGVLVELSDARIDPETAVGIYLFEEGRGNEVIDFSGKGHNGTIAGEGAKRGDGRFGSAIDVTAGGWVVIENTEVLHPVNAWTVVAWFNIADMTDHHTIVAKWEEYILRVDKPALGSKLTGYVKFPGDWQFWMPGASASVPQINTWVHAGMVWDNDGELKIYMDGVYASQETRQGEIIYNDTPLCIGSQNASGSFHFPGLIDEVGIFNVALSGGDIKLIMENGIEEALSGGSPVESQGGLATSWGGIKSEY